MLIKPILKIQGINSLEDQVYLPIGKFLLDLVGTFLAN